MYLPVGECCVFTDEDGVCLMADEVIYGLTDMPIAGSISKHLSIEEAWQLGHALIEAAKARSN